MRGKFPFFQQLDAADCGTACLRMVAVAYGKTVSPARLRQLTRQSVSGVSILHLAEAAEAIGFQTIAAELTFEELRDKAPLPAILFWRGDHFVVLYKLTNEKAIVADPAEGLLTLPIDVFKKLWYHQSELGRAAHGVVLALEPGPDFNTVPDDAPKSGLWRWLNHQTSAWKSLRVQLVLGLVVSGLLGALIPLLVKAIADEAIHLSDLHLAVLILLAWALLMSMRVAIEGLLDWIIRFVGQRLAAVGMSQFVGRVLDLPFDLLQGQMAEDLLRRVYGHEEIAQFLRQRWLPFLLATSLLVFFSLLLAWLYPWLLLPLVVGVGLELLVAAWHSEYRMQIEYRVSDMASKAHMLLADLLQGIRELKLSEGATLSRWEWERQRNQLFQLKQELEKRYARQSTWLKLIQAFRDVLLVGVATAAVVAHHLSVGGILAVIWITAQLGWVSAQISRFFSERGAIVRWFERVQEVWELPSERDESLRMDPLPEWQPLVLDHVHFAWKVPIEQSVLHDAHMTIVPRETTLIIGGSGSGKSTLIQLLAGLIRPDEGTIKYGPVDLGHVAPALWRKKCSVLFQGAHIFHHTIAKNIALGSEVPDMDRLREVARATHLLEWVDQLPLAFQTVVGEGGLGLSRGQIQQILLARLLYKDAEIYLMDEPTAGLDTPLARKILGEVQAFLEGKTVVVAAPHELASLDFQSYYLLTKGTLRLLESSKSFK